MKNFTIKKWLALSTAKVITASLLLFAANSYADDTNPPASNPSGNSVILQQILAQLTQFHANVVDALAKFINSQLNYSDLVKNRAAFEKAVSYVVKDSQDSTNSDTQNSLALDTQTYYKNIANGANTVNSSLNTNNAESAKQFSASSLIDNYSITDGSDVMTQAKQYIQFLSGQANPVVPPAVNMNTSSANSKIPVQQYKAALGTFTAAQSAALNTLYKALAARTVQKGLGTTAGIPNKPNASPLEVEQYMVSLPFTPEWSNQILTSANPADIQKQQLFMLAGIQNLLFQNQMQIEQLNINLAALILQTQQDSTRKGLTDMRNQAIKSLR